MVAFKSGSYFISVDVPGAFTVITEIGNLKIYSDVAFKKSIF